MPFALIAFGLLLTIAGARGTQGNLFALLEGDFTGSQSFLWWGASVVGIGAVGYVPKLRPLANIFLALILVVFVLAQYKGGNNIFQSFINQLKAGTTGGAGAANDNPTTGTQTSLNSSGLVAGAKSLASAFA